MSVINQLLLDLEKRRASPAERSALPDHVRALPQPERGARWSWAAGGTIAALACAAGSWALWSGFEWKDLPAAMPSAAATRGGFAPVAPVGAGNAAGPADVRPAAGPGQPDKEAAAARLSFELSEVPATAEKAVSTVPGPLAIARVVAEEAPAGAQRSPAPVSTTRSPAIRPDASAPSGAGAAAGSAPAKPEIQKQVRQSTPRELADNEYGKATGLLHQGRLAEAQEGFQSALILNPAHHSARQALVGLLLQAKRWSEAERVLQEGLALAPAQSGFSMTLARLQFDRGDAGQAVATLQRGLDHAQANADYMGFLAGLLQRQGRHEEAIAQFQGALRLKPSSGVWWLGLGISLQAANRPAEAQEAYRRARATNTLNADLAAFAEQRLRQLP